MVVFYAALAAFPVAVKIRLAVVMWRGPYGALIRWLCPITGMPLVILSVRIPITRDPDELMARLGRRNAQRPRSRRRSNSDSDGNLGAGYRSSGQKYRRQKCCTYHTLHLA